MDGYERTRAAIIEQAILDYKAALKKREYHRIKALEKWFLSAWGEKLSGGNGNYIIEQCRKTVTAKKNRRITTKGKEHY